MSIEDRLQVVKLAEIDCQLHTTHARDQWKKLKHDFRDSATPWRIVTVGAISGFLMGKTGGNGNGSVGAKLFGTLAQALITTLGAGATAGMAAGAAADAAAEATAEAVVDQSVSPESIVAAAREPALEPWER